MKVLMVGVSSKRVGGMDAVAQIYKKDQKYNSNVKLKYVSTSTNGSIIKRSLCMFMGYIKIFFELIFFKPDIVHIHMAEKGSTYRKGFVAKLSKKFNNKVIIHLHAGPFMAWFNKVKEKDKIKIKKIFSYADKILVLGNYWKDEMSKIVAKDKMQVLYNGVECPKNNNYKENSKNIVYFGVMRKEKGIYDLLNAIKLINDDLDKNVRVLLYGNDLEGNIKETIDSLELNDRVKMMGWISNQNVKKELEKAMIDILPSYYEGLSMTIIEGMASGVPIITTNISTMPEILGDYKYMIDAGDVEKLSKYILELVKKPQKRMEISKYEYERVIKIFSKDKFIENTLMIYYKLFNK